MNSSIPGSSAVVWKRLKLGAILVGALSVGGILTLMILARGKGEDIAGIIALALLLTLLSGVVAVTAAVLQKRAQKRADHP
ncbi:MAG TPA: hypothetical protein PLX89_04200 [Verrucomicrobiota bacterium]|nr:hypothetical protein [Verrucomicrobiota bacterium]